MRSPRLAARNQESRDPNEEAAAPVVPFHKRGAPGALHGSPARKKPSKKDRRRVSFAPDPELTLIHHFVKDDDYSSNSDGKGRVVVAYDEEPTVAQPLAVQQQLRQQHPALVGAAPDAGAGFPGFWNHPPAAQDNSPLGVGAAPAPQQRGAPASPLSPGMVSMEITQPTLAVQAQAQHVPGEVTAGLPSLGALAEADELEDEVAEQQQQQAMPVPVPGEVTAALPSLGALAEADELEEQGGVAQQAAGWAGAVAAANVASNITAALPALGALVEEDEEDAAGMDLTMPAGRVLEHHPQVQQEELAQQVQVAAILAAAAQSPAATAMLPVADPSPAMHNMEEQQEAAAREQLDQPVQGTERAPAEEAEMEPTAAVVTVGRRSQGRVSLGSADELVQNEAARAALLNKWGFAPGQEDTLDINLEMHGRMIMGDQTFNRMYLDNTTGEGGYGRSAAADDTGNSVLLAGSEDTPTGAAAAAVEQEAAAVGSPDASPGAHQQAALSPAAPQGSDQMAAAAPNWTAPAFLPPYMQAPAVSGAPSDHPALVQSPDVTGSSLNTLGTRRVSVGVGDPRRASITSRRFSMQDATGRLLVDDDILSPDTGPVAVASPAAEVEDAMPPGGMQASAGPRGRRRSSGAAFLGRDVTEKLLIDDESMDGDVGPLADLKRQMRMLSHGSPVLVPQTHAVDGAALDAPEMAEPGAAEQLQEAQAAPPEVGAAAKTPRAAVSMGYADSHNPATAALLRSGGTTRLLRGSASAASEDEEDVLADNQSPVAGLVAVAVGTTGGTEEEQLALADAGGITARTNGTTKLLADMTMASVVGAKLLGRQAHGTPELAHAPSNDGLTDFSLDQFEQPPELPGQQEALAATVEQQRQQQAAAQPTAVAEQQHYSQQAAQQRGEEYASPALRPGGAEFGTGYPVEEAAAHGNVIPGGPKLVRTPVTARPASNLRHAAQGTPQSHPRSLRSQQHLQQHATPSTHGTQGLHRLARTPGSTRLPAAAYPIDADAAADNAIPGGPKLARTPVGRTPATGGYHSAPGSAVAQHYPGSARAVHFAAGAGSASVQRYPGSAVAAHRMGGGMTPQYTPPPMTFQDFARLTEVQFLDNLRRGASINYADLQPNPVPASLPDAYRLLTIISPQVTTLESGIRILQEEVQARRISAADAEQQVGQVNPAAFQKAAAADDDALEELREHVGLLKKVCRQKAVYCLKDVRRQMEESRGARLQRNLEALQGDLALARGCREQLEGVARAAEQFIAEQHQRMAQEEKTAEEEAERRAGVVRMRQEINKETAANEQRRAQLAEAQQRVARLREEHAALQREREALRSRTDALQMTLMQSQGQAGGLHQESSPAAILQKLEELDALKRCVGWELESAAEDPVSGEVALRLADLFRLRLSISRSGVGASVEALPEEECKVPADRRALLAALAGCAQGPAAEVPVANGSAATVAALVQAATARLSRVADLASELDGLRLAFSTLADVSCSPDGRVALSFVNLDAEVKFSVSLQLPQTYPLGPVQHQTKIWFGDESQISPQRIAEAVALPAQEPGRLRAICQQLSQLACEVLPRPVLGQDSGAAAFRSQWQNPLFGSAPALSAQL